jgi:ABC-type cobalamin/Fe3+-siderophores transport system ATPase subunit
LSDRDEFRDSSALSTGHKCTAILPILLFESVNPLLIDQPEDNLDNSYVFETVVKTIRKVKAGRQMIFVTHNPNIPVLGEASMVFVMDSNRTQGGVANSGDVDHCKDDIVTILEGGKEAFIARMECYNY